MTPRHALAAIALLALAGCTSAPPTMTVAEIMSFSEIPITIQVTPISDLVKETPSGANVAIPIPSQPRGGPEHEDGYVGPLTPPIDFTCDPETVGFSLTAVASSKTYGHDIRPGTCHDGFLCLVQASGDYRVGLQLWFDCSKDGKFPESN